MSQRAEKLVEVYKAQGEAEAQVIRSKLEMNGIPSMIRSSASPSVHVFVLDGLGEYRIMVEQSRVEEARALIIPD
ncbi:MAG: DUF2007 domain-containing protein [Dehalococcoidales bacterium]|nr:DUF2007 domain-containing protein [Dehalococcoidales bacterium]